MFRLDQLPQCTRETHEIYPRHIKLASKLHCPYKWGWYEFSGQCGKYYPKWAFISNHLSHMALINVWLLFWPAPWTYFSRPFCHDEWPGLFHELLHLNMVAGLAIPHGMLWGIPLPSFLTSFKDMTTNPYCLSNSPCLNGLRHNFTWPSNWSYDQTYFVQGHLPPSDLKAYCKMKWEERPLEEPRSVNSIELVSQCQLRCRSLLNWN